MSHDKKTHVCPWWLGYFLLIPLRQFSQNPQLLLSPYVRKGMTVLEIGPGMGYFSLALAELVGEQGKVICVDIQEKMLARLRKRAQKAGLLNRIATILASQESLLVQDFEGKVDFTLAFAVVHEVPDQARVFGEMHRSMKPGGLLLLSEPKGHVTQEAFADSLAIAKATGFNLESHVDIKRSVSVLLRK
jgi:ubiquinone/menaquinone biosynthesis C-methylase UbiE